MGSRALLVAALFAAGCSIDAPEQYVPENCGNGQLDGGETCDDGNRTPGDGCSADCRSDETCGNGVIDRDVGEVCDDSNQVGNDGCAADCKSDETCGNGFVDTAIGETCDDSNTADADGCDPACHSQPIAYLIEADGLINQDTFCDMVGTNRTDGCASVPVGFTWQDRTPFVPSVIRIEFDNGVSCDGAQVKTTTLNGVDSGTFTIVPGECDCNPINHGLNVWDVTDLGAYAIGGTNTFMMSASSQCFGFSTGVLLPSFARITALP